MRRLRLRTQLSILAAFLAIYSTAIFLSFGIESRAQNELERAFQHDLATLTRLPRLGDLLRHQAVLSQQYLMTGGAEWLGERSRALSEIRRLQREIGPLLADAQEVEVWGKLNAGLEEYLAEQQRWIDRRQAGRLKAGSAVEVFSRSEGLQSLVDVLLAMRDMHAQELQRQREAARRASQVTFYMSLGTGFLISMLLVWFFSRYVIAPLTRLESYARLWKLGEEWTLKPSSTTPEIDTLASCLGEMSGRLNDEYGKERDLARFKSQLVSMVSHEFSNALSIIAGAAAVLEDSDKDKSGKRPTYYRMLKANIQALGSAAENLLNMGRLESGRFAISMRSTQLRDVIRGCVQRLELLSLRKNQVIEVILPDKPIVVQADPEALSLVMTNLVSNAIKYTPDGGRITVRLEPDPADAQRARVCVKDTGIGIKPEDHERVFSGFFRTEQGVTAAKGFGVGLSLAKRIVEAHESQITLESEVGKGSMFCFSLQLAKA